MKTLFCVFALALVVNVAQAAPAPNCTVYGIDNDNDRYCVVDLARPAPTDPAALTAYNRDLGPVDCNDADRAIHPDADEIVSDGIDQDCSCDPATMTTCPIDGDLTFATPDNVAQKFRCNPKNVRCMTILEAEIDACESAGPTQCEVDMTQGRFGIKYGYRFLDTDCNDGAREVVTQAAYDTYVQEKRTDYRNPTWEPRPDGRCGSSGGLGGGGGGGASAKAPALVARVDGHDGVLEALRQANTTIVGRLDGHDAALKALRVELNGEDGKGGLREEIRVTDEKFEMVRVALEGDDGKGGLFQAVLDVNEKAGQGLTDAAAAKTTADEGKFLARKALSRGMTLHGVVGTGFIFQGAMPLTSRNGNHLGNARGNFGTELRFGIDVGYAMPEGRFYASARFNPIWEEGPEGSNETGIVYEAGLAYEFGLTTNNLLGGHLTYTEHKSGGDVLGSNALARGVKVGPSYTHLLGTSAFETALNVRPSVGYEYYGSDGPGFSPSTDCGWIYGLTFEVKPGIRPVL